MTMPKDIIGLFDLKSPTVVGEIDAVFVPLLKLREIAAELYDVTMPPPVVRRNRTGIPDVLPEAALDEQKPAKSASERDIPEIVRLYRTDPRSTYHRLRNSTRKNYDALMRRILASEIGGRKLSDLRKEDFERIYETWKEGSGVSFAHSIMTMLRTIIGFGAETIQDDACLRLTVILHRMKLEVAKPRPRVFSAEWAKAIIAEAPRKGFPSIALAQAFQFECKIPQTAIIGQWVPIDDREPSDEYNEDRTMKWVHGLRWNQIDENLVLRVTTTDLTSRVIVCELNDRDHPMVMGQLRLRSRCSPHEKLTRAMLPTSGPVIINDKFGVPYLYDTYRRNWRTVATAAGVPKEISNRFSSHADAAHAGEAEGKGMELAQERP